MTVVYVAEVKVDGLGWVTIPEEYCTQTQAELRALAFGMTRSGEDFRVIEVPIGTREDE